MRSREYPGKQNIRSIVNQKSSILKIQMADFDFDKQKPRLKTSTILSSRTKRDSANKSSLLHKLIQNGSRYDTNSRRQSLESKVSIGFKQQILQDTTNYSDELKTLKQKNKQLMEENKLLKRKITQSGQKLNHVSSQKTLNSFDLVQLLEDSNRILKKKLQTNRHTCPFGNKTGIELSQKGPASIQNLYWMAFKQAKLPEIQPLTKTIKEYLKQYEEIFVKINFLVENIQNNQNESRLRELKQIVLAMKLPILYYHNPSSLDKLTEPKFTAQKRTASKTKSSKKQRSMLQLFAPELLSPEDTFAILEKILIKISKSFNMAQTFSQNSCIRKLLNKIFQFF